MANKFYAGQSFLALWLVIHVPLCQAASRFDGFWRGTYNSLHYEGLPGPGEGLEHINQFELRLHVRTGIVTGEFQRLGANSVPNRTVVTNGKLFGHDACFDIVVDDVDMRWCVAVSGSHLTGTWSGGPKGGPILGGAGAGVRSYDVTGRKVAG